MRQSISIAAFGILFAAPSVARAELVLRPSANGVAYFDNDRVGGGGSLGFSLAYNLGHESILVMPELMASFGGFGGGFGGFAARALGGIRFGLPAAVEPSLFFRAGYGNVIITRGDSSNLQHGVALNPGLGLDYRIEPWLTIGGEASYDVLLFEVQSRADAVHGLNAGLTLGFWL